MSGNLLNAMTAGGGDGTLRADLASTSDAVKGDALIGIKLQNYASALGISLHELIEDGIIGARHYMVSAGSSTTGSINSGNNILSVASDAGWKIGMSVRVTGAGNVTSQNYLVSEITDKNGTDLTLADNALNTVAGAAVAHENTAQLNALLNERKMPILLPPGTLRVGQLNIALNWTTILGGFGSTSIIGYLDSGPVINITADYGVSISDLTVNADTLTRNTSGDGISCTTAHAYSADGHIFRRLYVQNQPGNGFYGEHLERLLLDYVTFSGNNRGLYLRESGSVKSGFIRGQNIRCIDSVGEGARLYDVISAVFDVFEALRSGASGIVILGTGYSRQIVINSADCEWDSNIGKSGIWIDDGSGHIINAPFAWNADRAVYVTNAESVIINCAQGGCTVGETAMSNVVQLGAGSQYCYFFEPKKLANCTNAYTKGGTLNSGKYQGVAV